MRIRILGVASQELEEAVDYYNTERPGLGSDLAIEFRTSLDRIRQYPGAAPLFAEGIRRSRLSRFPYGVLYFVSNETILIVGFMHTAMDPKPWQNRYKD